MKNIAIYVTVKDLPELMEITRMIEHAGVPVIDWDTIEER